MVFSSLYLYYYQVSSVNYYDFPAFAAGTGVALAGVFLYSRVKRIKPKPKSA